MSEVTAPPAVQARLLELQELDTALDQARAAVRRLKADPEHARLRARALELEEALPGLEDAARTADRAGAEATEKAAATRARRDRTRERLEAGQGGSKELQAMQHEDDTLTALLDDHEAAALEAMEAADAAESRLAKGHAALEQARAEVEARAAEVRREGQ
ncbi:DNA-binding protein, partial [Micrococcus sp. HMSC31B01]